MWQVSQKFPKCKTLKKKFRNEIIIDYQWDNLNFEMPFVFFDAHLLEISKHKTLKAF